MRHALGIDVGGTNTKVGLVNEEGQLLESRVFLTHADQPFPDFCENLCREVDYFREKIKIDSIGVGAPNVSGKTGLMVEPPNFSWAKDKSGWTADGGVKFQETLFQVFATNVWVENDANVAAIGQKTFGRAKELSDFIVITVGTGIGTGIYCDGKLLSGKDGYAGEGGHIVVGDQNRPCGCGGVDHFESYCSVGNIKKRLAEKNGLPDSYRESIRMMTEKEGSYQEIEGIFQEAGKYFAKGLSTLDALFTPQKVFLTGGGITSNLFYFDQIQLHCKSLDLGLELELLPDTLGESAILGAAAGALRSC